MKISEAIQQGQTQVAGQAFTRFCTIDSTTGQVCACALGCAMIAQGYSPPDIIAWTKREGPYATWRSADFFVDLEGFDDLAVYHTTPLPCVKEYCNEEIYTLYYFITHLNDQHELSIDEIIAILQERGL